MALLKKIFPETLVEKPTTYLMKLEKLFKNEEFIDCFGNHEIPEEDKNYLETLKPSVVFESICNWDISLKISNPQHNFIVLNYKDQGYLNTDDKALEKEGIKITNLLTGFRYRAKTFYNNSIIYRTIDYIDARSNIEIEIISLCECVYAELKPLLGDDYPEVLRKMKSQIEMTDAKLKLGYRPTCCLIIGKFESRTTTEEQLIEIFGQTGIKVIFTRDLFEDDKITYTRSEMKSIEPESVISTLKSENIMLLQKLNEAEAKIMTLENQFASLKKTQKTQITSFFKPK
jgi:hypothetical protein